MLGIIFGGFINGIENEGLIEISNPLFDFGFAKFRITGSNWLHIRPLLSKGSMRTVFDLFLVI
jgi:hypothetical protein